MTTAALAIPVVADTVDVAALIALIKYKHNQERKNPKRINRRYIQKLQVVLVAKKKQKKFIDGILGLLTKDDCTIIYRAAAHLGYIQLIKRLELFILVIQMMMTVIVIRLIKLNII